MPSALTTSVSRLLARVNSPPDPRDRSMRLTIPWSTSLRAQSASSHGLEISGRRASLAGSASPEILHFSPRKNEVTPRSNSSSGPTETKQSTLSKQSMDTNGCVTTAIRLQREIGVRRATSEESGTATSTTATTNSTRFIMLSNDGVMSRTKTSTYHGGKNAESGGTHGSVPGNNDRLDVRLINDTAGPKRLAITGEQVGNSRDQMNWIGGVHGEVHECLHDEEVKQAGILRLSPHVHAHLTTSAVNPDQQTFSGMVQPSHTEPDRIGNDVVTGSSLAIVPYTARDHHRVRLAACVPLPKRNETSFRFAVRSTRLVPCKGGENGPLTRLKWHENGSTSVSSGPFSGPNVTSLGHKKETIQVQECVILSTEQIAYAASKLHEEAEKNKALEATIANYKRERVLIYDAAMKQAAKREEENIKATKQHCERGQALMRAEVDLELGKVNDLYNERCRDFAQMVSDECEGEISKTVADLRREWAGQKKTIADLVRGDGEDRQVTAITRAVVEQLQEEKRDELSSIRADIYADMKMEFESREVALREDLQSDFKADLDGQLLLADVRHQKDLDHLRTKLRGDGSHEMATRTTMTHDPETPDEVRHDEQRSHPPPSSYPRRNLKRNMPAGTMGKRKCGGSGSAVLGTGRQDGRLKNVLPAFKLPALRLSPGDEQNGLEKLSRRATSKATSQARRNCMERVSCTPSLNATRIKMDSVTEHPWEGDEVEPGDNDGNDIDYSITNALMVSPTKSIPGVSVTPSGDADEGTTFQPARPIKRAKRLFEPHASQTTASEKLFDIVAREGGRGVQH